jgi:hypothetical protein
MRIKKSCFTAGIVGCAMAAILLLTLTGCAGPSGGSSAGDNGGVFAAQDDYIYYPQYECYYSASRHQYAYREGNQWVSRSEMHGVPTAVLRTSPSVPMNFHDSPAQHHETVAKQYPKNWTPSGGGQDQDRK